jgi:hypothetical protein
MVFAFAGDSTITSVLAMSVPFNDWEKGQGQRAKG